MAKLILPDQDYLRQCFYYNPSTGELIWKFRPKEHFKNLHAFRIWTTQNAGRTAGYMAKNRRRVSINKTTFCSAPLIWKLMTGETPPEVDHKNNDPSDERWVNLRAATPVQNASNRTCGKKSNLPKGVYVSINKWCAHIMHRGKQQYLGTFNTPEEAHKAYCEAAVRLHGEFANFGKR